VDLDDVFAEQLDYIPHDPRLLVRDDCRGRRLARLTAL